MAERVTTRTVRELSLRYVPVCRACNCGKGRALTLAHSYHTMGVLPSTQPHVATPGWLKFYVGVHWPYTRVFSLAQSYLTSVAVAVSCRCV